MAPSSGHLLVPKAMRVVKFALSKTKTFLRDKLASTKNTSTTTTAHAVLNPIPIPIRPSRHPLPFLRHSRPFTTSRLHTPTPKSTTKPPRTSLPASTTARRAGTPFSSTLRPNLTGGALPRTSGGYSLSGGAGARHFSHTPAAPAQVVQNVSAACRAFWLGGQKARFDGVDARSGEKKYRCVSRLQETARRAGEFGWQGVTAGGARVEFAIAPTVTALTGAWAAGSAQTQTQTLGTEGVLDGLAGDFARAVGDLAAVLADLKRLAVLGDLPVAVVPGGDGTGGARVCVGFPGCDEESVESLCLEVGVRRGVVRAWAGGDVGRDVKMALLFPFAPGSGIDSVAGGDGDEGVDGYFGHADKVDWRHMMSPTQEGSLTSRASSEHVGSDEGFVDADMPIADSPSGYSSLHDSDYEDDDDLRVGANDVGRGEGGAADYDGLEGIYRFLSECEGARR